MKRLIIEVDEALHKTIRSIAFKQEKSMKQYITEVIKEEIKKNDSKNRELLPD